AKCSTPGTAATIWFATARASRYADASGAPFAKQRSSSITQPTRTPAKRGTYLVCNGPCSAVRGRERRPVCETAVEQHHATELDTRYAAKREWSAQRELSAATPDVDH